MTTPTPLTPEQLLRRCDPAQFQFASTADLEDLAEVIGQPRALDAVRFGIGIHQAGYNLFALGPAGVGKSTAVSRFIEAKAATRPVPPDWCYVHNFAQAHLPNALRLPAGWGPKLHSDMRRLLEELQGGLPAAFESDDYHNQRQAIDEQLKKQQEQAFDDLQHKAREKKIALLQTPSGLAFAPLRDGEVITPKEFFDLPDDQQKQIQGEVDTLQGELQRILRQVPQWRKENREQIRQLNQNVASFTTSPLFDELKEKYADLPETLNYLEAVRRYTIDNVEQFLGGSSDESPLAAMMGISRPAHDEEFLPYQVNVLVNHEQTAGAPVVYCDLPTYQNLIGRVEHVSEMGALTTNFTLIKPGALHKANGGYLILDVRKMLQQPYAYEGLKRALQAQEIVLESLGQVYSLISTISLEPEPIPLDVKVVLLGDRLLYYLLHEYDPEFAELFKVMADFADEMPYDEGNSLDYARLVATLVRKESLKHFSPGAVARVIEYSTRLAGDQEKLSTHMQSIADLVRQASFWAAEAGRELVQRGDVQQAIDTQEYHTGRVRERMQEAILRETVLIDTSGAKVGQINGLSVLMLGNTSFGKPSRITAQIRMGKGDVVDIERQVEMGGPIHSKGVMILSSFLAGRYATERPLSLSASLVFEQSYGGVDGDSASSAELYALLSTLANVPIRQSLAVTGSVNQLGQVQAIGGVNEKIEGFFDICRSRGLTGEQGVLIPSANVRHLMLRQDVIDAVSAGHFHIYPVSHVDEGLALLTGLPAGEPNPDGSYPAGSLNRLIVDRLEDIIQKQRQYAKPPKDEEIGANEKTPATPAAEPGKEAQS